MKRNVQGVSTLRMWKQRQEARMKRIKKCPRRVYIKDVEAETGGENEKKCPRSVYTKDVEAELDGENEKTKDIFFFKEGCVVFWNVPELERSSVLKFLKLWLVWK